MSILERADRAMARASNAVANAVGYCIWLAGAVRWYWRHRGGD